MMAGQLSWCGFLGLVASTLSNLGTWPFWSVVAVATEGNPSPEAATEGHCTVGKGGCAATASADVPLRWRGKTYNSSRSLSIYGGEHAVEIFARVGFEGPVEDDEWDLLFTHHLMGRALAAVSPLPERQGRLVNHCQYFLAAGDKCKLSRHIARVEEYTAASERSSPLDRPRFLRTFELGDNLQNEAWHEAMKSEPNRHWIIKPCIAGQSKGIELIRGRDFKVDRDQPRGRYVAQEFVERPFLGFGGRKFHLRLYVLVTRWDPPGVFMYDEGMLFRSERTYDPDRPSRQHDIFSGISKEVQPHAFAALWSDLGEQETKMVRERIVALLAEVMRGKTVEVTFGDPQSVDDRGYSCFDLFGADVILDENLQPFLMEINQGPDLWVVGRGAEHEPFQRRLKGPLLQQLAHWVALRVKAARHGHVDAWEVENEALLNYTRVL